MNQPDRAAAGNGAITLLFNADSFSPPHHMQHSPAGIFEMH
jgi:hypothetical protein